MRTVTESKHTHTPGPWRIRNKYIETDRDGGNTIATVTDWLDKFGDEQAANARLIAAAPAMLEALENMLAAFEQNGWHKQAPETYRFAEAAIKLAKGEL